MYYTGVFQASVATMIKSVRAEILALKSLAMAPPTLNKYHHTMREQTLPYAFKSKLNQHGPFSVP